MMRSRKNTLKVALVVVLCSQIVMASTPVYAAHVPGILAYDDFSSYSLGNIVGQATMGTGFSGANWTQNSGTNNVVSGGLTYLNLEVSGNQHVDANITATTNDLRGLLDTSGAGPFTALMSGTGKINQGTVYFSWLGVRPTTSSGWGGSGGTTFNGAVNHPAANDLGFANDGLTHLIAGKIEFNTAGDGSDRLTAWDNPTPGAAEGATGTLIQNFTNLTADAQWAAVDGINQFLSRGSFRWEFDEIRFGSTFESVTPAIVTAPEPSSILLALFGLAGLLSFRRRRRRA